MSFHRVPAILLLIACLLPGCSEKVSPPAVQPILPIDPRYGHLLHAQPKLPTIKIQLKDRELIAEVADQPLEIATGMMFRTNMLENEAMLFVFGDVAPRSFYMRNCFVPLSGAYISPGGEILQIIDMKPHDERGIPSFSDNVQFVLEVPRGWFERHQIEVGTVVRTEQGSLRDTFFSAAKP